MPQVDVLIKKNADGQLDEQINLANEFKKVKTRALKAEYKASMKHPTRYPETHMADNDHAPLFVRKLDNITFYHHVPFRLLLGRDPEIEEDFSSDDSPFLNASGCPVLQIDASPNMALPAGDPKKFFAGPFTRNPQAKDQKFYKFSVVTAEFLTLDPDIIIDPMS
jgi:hypothetical protein